MPSYDYPNQDVVHGLQRRLAVLERDLVRGRGFSAMTLPTYGTQPVNIPNGSIYITPDARLAYTQGGNTYIVGTGGGTPTPNPNPDPVPTPTPQPPQVVNKDDTDFAFYMG